MKLHKFTFKSEAIWMLAFPLVPAIAVCTLLLILELLGILR